MHRRLLPVALLVAAAVLAGSAAGDSVTVGQTPTPNAPFTINQLVGISIEALILRELDQNARYDFLGGKTPNARTEELKQQKLSFDALSESFFDLIGIGIRHLKRIPLWRGRGFGQV